MIQLTAIQKKFSSRLILDIPDFSIETGIYWIQGVNGSGKTTLLKMLAGVIPFKGDVRVNETSQKKSPVAYRRLISYAEAEPLYPSYLRGQDILDLYLAIRKDQNKMASELINKLQVQHYLMSPIGSYSSGMLKKLSLVLAFTGAPAVIMLDEPLVTIDAESIPNVYWLINEFRKRFNTTFLLTSHQDFTDAPLAIDHAMLVENQTIRITR